MPAGEVRCGSTSFVLNCRLQILEIFWCSFGGVRPVRGIPSMEHAPTTTTTTVEKKVCRLCIKNEGTVPVFQDDGHLRPIAIQIMAISNVHLSLSEKLPLFICNECLVMVQTCFNFKVQCEASEATLRATLATCTRATQNHSTGATSAVATSSNQPSETHDKLGETRGKLTTLVATIGKAEEKNCCKNSPKFPVKTVRFSRTNMVVRGNTCTSEAAEIEVVDITDDAENPGSTAEQQQESSVEFRGFANPSAPSRSSKAQRVTVSSSPDTSSMMSFSDVPGCYRIELDSESEMEVNCGFTNRQAQS